MLWPLLSMAFAQSATGPVATMPSTDDALLEPADTEIIVYGDLFARWDNTRWAIATESTTPFPTTMKITDQDYTLSAMAVQARAVLACDKEFGIGKRRISVRCTIEQISLRAVPSREKDKATRVEEGNQVLQTLDERLTGAQIQLITDDRGQVSSVDIDNALDRGGADETLRVTMVDVLHRLGDGFDLHMRPGNDLREGKWTEYDVPLVLIPGSNGSSYCNHYLNAYQGHTLVQTICKGTCSPGNLATGGAEGGLFENKLHGVSIFDKAQGYMTERVWVVDGQSTAGTYFTTLGYHHAGRIEMLGETDRVDVGESYLMSGRNEEFDGLPKWMDIEQDPILHLPRLR